MFVTGDPSSIIADIGTETLKIGYSGSESPSIYRTTPCLFNNYTSPVVNSIVQDIPGYFHLLQKYLPSFESQLLIAEHTLQPSSTRREMLGPLFESRLCNSVLFVKSAVLDLFAYGKSTGVVVALSGGSTTVVTIVEGMITHQQMVGVGGFELTRMVGDIVGDVIPRQMIKSKSTDGYETVNLSWTSERLHYEKTEVYRDIKERMCSVRTNKKEIKKEEPTEEMKKEEMILNEYELPTGKYIQMGQEKYELYECIFKELATVIHKLIEMNDPELRFTLLGNIVLSGGVGNAVGITERLIQDLYLWYPVSKIKIVHDKRFNTFFGGAIVGSLGSARALYISAEDYQEVGEGILDRKKCDWLG
ncbi:actin [Astathelohania contejeani]|uniref:Actin n=1 Tax=Astathelohania contejeani TaxID=164912 RepID=A0ABQ7HVV4_9MICR|nr:actin [Thelohania contejeani]